MAICIYLQYVINYYMYIFAICNKTQYVKNHNVLIITMYEIKQCMIITNMKNAKITGTNRRSSTPTPQKKITFGSGRLNV